MIGWQCRWLCGGGDDGAKTTTTSSSRRGRTVALGSLALILVGISAWLETPNLCWVSSLLAVGAALRTEGLSVGHPAQTGWSTQSQR